MSFGATAVVLSILYRHPNIWSPSLTPFPLGKMQWVDPKSIRCLTWHPYMQILFILTVMYLVLSIKLITFDIKLKDWTFFKTYLVANICPLKHCVFSPLHAVDTILLLWQIQVWRFWFLNMSLALFTVKMGAIWIA